MSHSPLHLFQGFGVELEYMIVARDSLCVLPICDDLLRKTSGSGYVSHVERGVFGWANELVNHVVELRNAEPVPSLAPLTAEFQSEVRALNRALASFDACLMPTGMHPWMNPAKETRLWEHEYHEVYQAFDRIFDCKSHGWANLQSVQLNLPFGSEEEFGRLHAAVRLVLPILPALAASSPVMEGRITGVRDNRLEMYRTNARKIASITGHMIPEPVFSFDDYQRVILHEIYHDIAPYDPEKLLQHEWLNARAAIARFDRNAIEIRILDMQEHPAADLAICQAATDLVHAVLQERWTRYTNQRAWQTEPLESILLATMKRADQAVIDDRAYLKAFGYPGGRSTAAELWRHLARELDFDQGGCLELVLDRGPLARRIVEALGNAPDQARLEIVYRELCRCLDSGIPFQGVQ